MAEKRPSYNLVFGRDVSETLEENKGNCKNIGRRKNKIKSEAVVFVA